MIKKLRNNKLMVLIISVVVVSIVYFVARKAIDNYVFETNSDIVTYMESDGGVVLNADNLDIYSSERVKVRSEENEEVFENGGEISSEETALVLEEDIEDENSEVNGAMDVGEATAEKNKIYVYITGEVNIPGVVILDEGSRIVDAINAAGGTTSKANVSKVNLVYVLDDGMKVNIPSESDLKNNSDFEYITMSSGDAGREDYSNGRGTKSSETNTSGSSSSSANSSSGSGGWAGSYKSYMVVNINTATQTELETLPGIGPSLALKIINYRKENGKFYSIDEIKNVSGIGESKFNNLKSYITV